MIMKKLALIIYLFVWSAFSFPAAATDSAPSIFVDALNVSSPYGGSAAFTIMAQGTKPLSYQWYKDGVSLISDGSTAFDGAKASALTVRTEKTEAIGNYWVVVGNSLGSATGRVATLSLSPDYPAKKASIWPSDARGLIDAVAVQEGYAYFVGSSGFQVVDIGNPENLKRLGGCQTDGYPTGVAVMGNYAYVAAREAGLQVIDISNPTRPTRVGALATVGNAAGVAVAGHLAFVANGSRGLEIIDITNPATPQAVGNIRMTWAAYGVAVAGKYVYVASTFSGLVVIDVENPSSPKMVGNLNLNGPARAVAVMGNYAYVAASEAGIQVIDISKPSRPRLMGSYDTSGYAFGVAMMGHYVYVSDYHAGLQAFDVSDPSNPQRVGGYNTVGFTSNLALAGKYAFIACAEAGLQVIDVGDPANPRRAGGYDDAEEALGIATMGKYAYVAYGTAGLRVVDIGNMAQPEQAGIIDTEGSAQGVALMGHYACVADGAAGLQVIDVGDPANPRRAGGFDTGGNARGVAVTGNYAIVAAEGAGLRLIDLENPTSPRLAGAYTNSDASGVAVSGHYAFMTGSNGLQAIDIANPASPKLADAIGTGGNAAGVALLGHYAYVACGKSGLQVIDIDNPANLRRVSAIHTDSAAVGVAVMGKYAFVAAVGTGLEVFDVVDPAMPLRMGAQGTTRIAKAVALMGDYAFLAGGFDGIEILQISGIAPVIVEQPTRQLVRAGERVVLGAWASGTPDIYYQWHFNGANLSSQTNATLILPSVTSDQIGMYSVSASNAWGTATSETAAIRSSIPLDEALDATNLVWRTGGAAPWTGVFNNSNDGVDAARSGAVGVNEQSWIETTVAGPGSLKFWWAYVGYGWVAFQFSIDGVIVKNIYSYSSFNEAFELGPGNHVLRWSFTENDSSSLVQDMGLLDQVSYVPLPPKSAPWIVSQPAGSRSFYGETSVFNVAAQGSDPLSYQWFQDGKPLAGSGSAGIIGEQTPTLTVGSVQPVHDGSYYAVVGNAFGSVTSQVVRLSLMPEMPLAKTGAWVNDSNNGISAGIVVTNNYAYLASGAAGLLVIDVADPQNPRRVGGCDTIGYAYGIAVADHYAYVAAGTSGLKIIDISKPESPLLVGGQATRGLANGVAVTGHYAYVSGSDGLDVLDIGDPANALLLGGNDFMAAKSIDVLGNYAFVSSGPAGLTVLDISDPTSPWLANQYYHEGTVFFSVLEAALKGNYAYAAGGGDGLVVFDIDDPENPVRAGGCQTLGYARHIAVSGNYAYMANSGAGLQVIDIVDPRNPLRAGRYSNMDAQGVAVAGMYAYVPNATGGLTVLQISGFAPLLVQQPASQTANVGDCVVVSGWARGTPPLSYQWFYNGAAMPGKTNATVVIPAMASDQAGLYSMTASNAWGIVESSAAQVELTGSVGLFEIKQIASKPEGVVIRFKTLLGKIHRIERNDTFPGGSWRSVSDVIHGNGEVIEFLDAGSASLNSVVYRIRAE
jgi:hypothetical protein